MGREGVNTFTLYNLPALLPSCFAPCAAKIAAPRRVRGPAVLAPGPSVPARSTMPPGAALVCLGAMG